MSQTRPILLALHGSAQDETALASFVRQVALGWPVSSPRGSVAQDTGHTFFPRRSDHSIDGSELRRLARQALTARGAVPVTTSGAYLALGYSSGAIFATALLCLAPRRFAGAVLLRPEPVSEGLTVPDLTGLPVLIVSGANDTRRKPDDAHRLADQLREAGADLSHHHLDCGHGWADDQQDARLVQDWLGKHFGFV